MLLHPSSRRNCFRDNSVHKLQKTGFWTFNLAEQKEGCDAFATESLLFRVEGNGEGLDWRTNGITFSEQRRFKGCVSLVCYNSPCSILHPPTSLWGDLFFSSSVWGSFSVLLPLTNVLDLADI